MAQTSRIRFNPVTRDVEIEGSEAFIQEYFDKIQALINTAVPAARTGKPGAKSTAPKGKKENGRRRKTAGKAKKVKTTKRMKAGDILALVEKSPEGIGAGALAVQTGYTEIQVRGTLFRALKEGKIQKVGRGLFTGISAAAE